MIEDTRVTITLGRSPRDCRIEINGEAVNARSINVHAGVHDVTTVTVELLPTQVEINGEAIVLEAIS